MKWLTLVEALGSSLRCHSPSYSISSHEAAEGDYSVVVEEYLPTEFSEKNPYFRHGHSVHC